MAVNTVISTNVISLNSARNLKETSNSISIYSERLSSGLRINSASDDAAGLAISQKMKAQLRGIDKAEQNTEDSIAMLTTVEAALSEIGDVFQRARELSVQAANDTNDEEDKRKIATEILEVLQEVDRIYENAEYNGTKVFSSRVNYNFQIGANSAQSVNFSEDFLTLEELMTDFNIDLYEEINTFFNETVRSVINEALSYDPYDIGNTATIYGKSTALVDYSPWLNEVLEGLENMNTLGSTDIQEILESMKVEIEALIQEVREDTEAIFTQRLNSSSSANMYSGLWLYNAFAEGSLISEDTAKVNNLTRPSEDAVRVNASDILVAIQDESKIVAIDSNFEDLLNGLSDILDSYSEIVTDESLYTQYLLRGLEDFVAGTDTITAEQFSELYISVFDECIDYISEKRSDIGVTINRLEYTLNNLQVTGENLSSANSRIEDADMAQELMNLTKYNVLSSAAMYLLAQSNSSKEDILHLLS